MTFHSRIGIWLWPFIIIIIHSFFYSRTNPTCLWTWWRVLTHTNLTSFSLHGWYSLCQRLLSVDAVTKALKSHETPWKFPLCAFQWGSRYNLNDKKIRQRTNGIHVIVWRRWHTHTTHIYIRSSESISIESKISCIYSVRVSLVCWFCEHLRILQTNFDPSKRFLHFPAKKKTHAKRRRFSTNVCFVVSR